MSEIRDLLYEAYAEYRSGGHIYDTVNLVAWGPSWGSSYDVANARWLHDTFNELVSVKGDELSAMMTGGAYVYGCDMDCETIEGLAEVMDRLEDYPIFDDLYLSQWEGEVLNATLESEWFLADLRSEVQDLFTEQYRAALLTEEATDAFEVLCTEYPLERLAEAYHDSEESEWYLNAWDSATNARHADAVEYVYNQMVKEWAQRG